MNVTYLSGVTLPSRRANAVHVMKMCSAMVRVGHQVTLFARGEGQTLEQIFSHYGTRERFQLELASSKNGRFSTIRYMGRFLRYSISHSSELYYARYRPLAMIAALLGKQLIFEVHEVPARWQDRLMERLILRASSLQRVVAISGVLAQDYIALFPHLRNKMLIAHDAADEVSTPLLPRSISPNGDRLIVGYAGSLYPGKGIEVIVELAPRCPWADFHIVGGDKEHVDYWSAKAKSSNIFFHGHVPHGKLSSYLASFDIAIAPLQKVVSVDFGSSDIGRWTSPLKIFEYMAHGLPIVLSQLPTLEEVLTHEVNCLFAPPDSIDEWVAALARLQADLCLRARLANEARGEFLKKYTWTQRARVVLT